MTDFHALDRGARTYALVGRFFFEWALMDMQLQQALGKALSLSDINTRVVATNIQLTDKLYILRTTLHLSDGIDDERKAQFNKVLKEIGVYLRVRNMIAHSAFNEDPNGDGVSFYVIKAHGTYRTPAEDWTVARFEDEYEKIRTFAAALEDLTAEISQDVLSEALASGRLSPSDLPIADVARQ